MIAPSPEVLPHHIVQAAIQKAIYEGLLLDIDRRLERAQSDDQAELMCERRRVCIALTACRNGDAAKSYARLEAHVSFFSTHPLRNAATGGRRLVRLPCEASPSRRAHP
jgi:hypothetical protein